jgi:repressor LexA
LPPPTLDQACAALGLRSRGSLHKQVRALEEAELLQPAQGLQRGLRLRQHGSEGEVLDLPLAGVIAAGRPIEALQQDARMPVPRALFRGKADYVLRVRGESMIEEGILDGDYVVIEAREDAREGEIVVALIDGNEATLKRLGRAGDKLLLIAANPNLAPMVFEPERVQIQGVVAAQMRSYR